MPIEETLEDDLILETIFEALDEKRSSEVIQYLTSHPEHCEYLRNYKPKSEERNDKQIFLESIRDQYLH